MAKKQKLSASAGMDDRSVRQNAEGYDMVAANLPSDRVQAVKQVPSEKELAVSDTVVKGESLSPIASAAKKLSSSIKVKPSAGITLLDGKQVGGVPLSGDAVVASVAGAESFSTTEDRSRAPYSAGGYRPDTRFGKTIADKTFKINQATCEQIDPGFEESKAIYENPSEGQGYNGRKKFNVARGKKNTGKDPHDLLFFRSADFIDHSERLYTTGQVLDSITPQAGYPTRTFVGEGANGYEANQIDSNGYAIAANVMEKGNYSLDTFNIVLKNGHIDKVSFGETRFVSATTRVERDVANLNWQVDANNVTAAMLRMQTELGRETTDKWSPLGYVIEEGYQYNMLYHDMEAMTGAIAATAYRSAVSSMAIQLNDIGKDGADPILPAARMVLGGIGDVPNSSLLAGVSMADLFSTGVCQKGAVTAIIKMFDSTNKYKSKADLLTAQRGLKYHLSSADNNLNPLHVKPEFIKALNSAHTFSTYDGSYNPALPVYRTQTIRLTNPMSLNFFLEGWVNPNTTPVDNVHDPVTGTKVHLAYAYSDLRNAYTTPVKHPLIEGLLKWLLEHEGGLVTAFGANATITMPATFNFINPSLFSFMICAAMQDIAFQRNVFFRDILFAGEQSSYVWDDLKGFKEVDPLWSSQLRIKSYDSGLELGALTPAVKIRTAWPEHWAVHGEQAGEGCDFIAPWYHNEHQYLATGDGVFVSILDDSAHSQVMTLPSIRDGVRHEYVDLLYSMSERDLRLVLDRMVTLPVITQKSEYREMASAGPNAQVYIPLGGTYTPNAAKTSQMHINAVRYDNNSDGRVQVTYDENLPVAALCCVARELGFIEPEYGACRPVISAFKPSENNVITFADVDYTIVSTAGYNVAFDGSTAWALRSFQATGAGTPITAQAISQTAALKQWYETFYAARFPALVSFNEAFGEKIGFTPTVSALFTAGSLNTVRTDIANIDGVYALRSTRTGVGNVSSTFISLVKALYGVMQRVFFATNPFENCLASRSATGDVQAGVYVDPMEMAYLFGVAGSLASDYNQDVLSRLDELDQLGINYLKDNFVAGSLLFRE